MFVYTSIKRRKKKIILHVPQPCLPVFAAFSGWLAPRGHKKAASSTLPRLASHTTKSSRKVDSPFLQAYHTPKVPVLTRARQNQYICRILGFASCLSIVWALLATVSLAHLFLVYLRPEVQENNYVELSCTRVG